MAEAVVLESRVDPASPHRGGRFRLAAAAALALAVVAGVAARLRFGVDLTDESFYVALARRFAQGDSPFVDDWTALQMAGYAISPFAKAWMAAWGTEGIVFGFRVAYLALNVLVISAVFPFLQRAAGRVVALAIGATFVSLVPFLLPSLSYNTLAVAMLALGLCGGASALEGDRYGALLAGFGLTAATFVYPTLVVVAVAALASLVGTARERCIVWACLAGAAPVALIGLWMLLRFGSGIPDTLAYLSTLGAYLGGDHKLIRLIEGSARLFATQPVLWVSVAVVGVRLARSHPLPWRTAPLVVAASAIPFFVQPYVASLTVATLIVIVAPLVVIAVGSSGLEREEVWVFALGILAAIVTAYTSSNAAVNLGIGALGALMPSLAMLARRVRRPVSEGTYERWFMFACTWVASCALLISFSACYRDEPPKLLVHRVESGPYAGLRTTVERALQIRRLTELVRQEVDESDRIVAFPEFLEPYLLTDARAATPILWISDVDEQRDVFALVRESLSTRDVPPTVVLRRLSPTGVDDMSSRFDGWVFESFSETARNEHAVVYRTRRESIRGDALPEP